MSRVKKAVMHKFRSMNPGSLRRESGDQYQEPEGRSMPANPDPFAAKRAAMLDEYYGKFFLLGGWLGATDTYKRTMWTAVPDIALAHAGYGLTMRKGLPEAGSENQLIMAGHETMLSRAVS